HDPFMMTGIAEAVALLEQAIEDFMPITVYGDYDCDGVCASSIIYTTLRDVGADIIPYIPARHTEGYGLNEKAIRSIAKRGGLLITVECGITNIKEINLAKELGLQVIVTDHHQVLDELPDCIVVDPTQDDAYPFKGLCGAGVALKLMEALTDGDIQEALDLAAIATVADIVPLTDENRTIVKAGLRRITSMPRPGIEALIKAAGLQAPVLTSENIAFAIAPRINAAGRMGDAMDAFTLLTGDEVDIEAAEQLDRANAERQRIEREIVAQAYGLLEEDRSLSRSTVVAGKGWHLGVIGIAASKIVSITGKPTAVVSEAEDGLCIGSARGIPGVNIFQALDSCKDLLVRYGGHAQAGGFSLKKESMEEFIERFDNFFCDHYTADIWGPVSECDLELEPDEITMEFAQSMAMLEPFGFGNPTPVILVRNARITRRIPMGSAGDHARLYIKKDERECEVVAFRIREKGVPESDAIVDFSAAVSIDHWNGRSRVQCLLRDIRPSIGYFLNMIKKETGLFGYGFARNCISASPVSRREIDKALNECKTVPFGYLFKALTPAGAMRSVKEMHERGLLYTAELYWRT
ncbi:MAG: single-stranded-DNA-specific exonuclease RecJ, partial [Clostridia bacterium]|nr:single-stranded-DNA-specific exonuclease RecJ [Clostridia bacterium]